MSKAEWEFGFVLPNLVLPSELSDTNPGAWVNGIAIGSAPIAIVRNGDPRVVAMRRESAAVRQILESFRDEYGKAYGPALLILRKDAPETIRHSLETIVAFRNLVAMSIVLPGRAAVAKGGGSSAITWSDTFDFHPAQVGRSGRMVLQSPAVTSLVSDTDKLRLTHSAYVKPEGRRIWPDHYLLRAMGRAWLRRFAGNYATESFGDRLFRSLEAAYQASAIGAKNEGSLAEYGIQVSLWVSAAEILAWPERKHADLEAVLALLRKYPSRPSSRKRRFRLRLRKKTVKLDALQRTYVQLNRARNAFLHGNPVGYGDMIVGRGEERMGLPRVAALVYRAALVAYLDRRYPKEICTMRELGERSDELFGDSAYEEALARLYGYEL